MRSRRDGVARRDSAALSLRLAVDAEGRVWDGLEALGGDGLPAVLTFPVGAAVQLRHRALDLLLDVPEVADERERLLVLERLRGVLGDVVAAADASHAVAFALGVRLPQRFDLRRDALPLRLELLTDVAGVDRHAHHLSREVMLARHDVSERASDRRRSRPRTSARPRGR